MVKESEGDAGAFFDGEQVREEERFVFSFFFFGFFGFFGLFCFVFDFSFLFFREKEVELEQEQEQEIQIEKYVDLAYRRDNEHPTPWPFKMLAMVFFYPFFFFSTLSFHSHSFSPPQKNRDKNMSKAPKSSILFRNSTSLCAAHLNSQMTFMCHLIISILAGGEREELRMLWWPWSGFLLWEVLFRFL